MSQLAIEPDASYEIPATPVVPVVGGGIVSRRALFERLTGAARVTLVSAPAGSGKTVLLRSWIADAGLVDRAAWVPVQGDERDPQQFWVAVADALRGTAAAGGLVRPLTAAPDLDGWAVVERLLDDLGSLRERVWLVIDDLHELECSQTLAQLELLVLRAPAELRLVLAARCDPRLGLHRLRLEGELTEIRAADLRFTVEEARALFGTVGVELPDPVLALLVERTEGWAAGLRLAALSLARSPEPERFAAEFCGSEQTVAEYLLAEVLERQTEPVRRLLLRTSVLERVNGELADLLTGDLGGERVLQELRTAGAFVVALDARRSWFRYHRLFADLLQLELRSSEPALIPALHSAAAGWFAGHGHPVEAIRHAQAAQDWDLATRLLCDHWLGLVLGGRGGTVREFLARFPAILAADPELAALRAYDELDRGSLEQAGRYLALAGQGSGSVPAERHERFEAMLAVLRLRLARQGGDLPAVMEEAQRLLAPAETGGPSGMELRALALTSLGTAELWAGRLEDAESHLEQGATLARRIGQPYLETDGLAHLSLVTHFRSLPRSEQQARQAVELAQRHGWTDEPAVAVAYLVLSGALFCRGQLQEAEQWLGRAEHALRADVEPAGGILLHLVRGGLELARGRDAEALTAYQAAMPLADLLTTPYPLGARARARTLQTLVRLGDTARADAILTALDARDRETPEMRIVLAALRLARDDPQEATTALAPVLSGSAPVTDSLGSPVHVSAVEAIAGGFGDSAMALGWLIQAWLVEAIARDALGDTAAAEAALERALGLAAPSDVLVPFLFHRAPELLKRHIRHHTAHAALISRILHLLAHGAEPAEHSKAGNPPVRGGSPEGPLVQAITEPLSQGELRVLRYLPSDLSVQEIASELTLSVNTIRTHMRHIYDKLQAHRRRDVVARARALGLLTSR
jgi:LuxR family transcriptional regulator, maltose regulon positive regulatory protein